MPRRNTHKASPRVQTDHPASGIYYPRLTRAYLFAEFRAENGVKTVLIGRGRGSDIRIVEDLSVSESHAIVECFQDRTVWIREAEKVRNGIYIDDVKISQPVKLTVGMDIWIGRTRLIATDAKGSFPIAATTISELCRRSVDMYGNQVVAGIHLGRGKDFIRRQFLPRSQRYTKFKPEEPGE